MIFFHSYIYLYIYKCILTTIQVSNSQGSCWGHWQPRCHRFPFDKIPVAFFHASRETELVFVDNMFSISNFIYINFSSSFRTYNCLPAKGKINNQHKNISLKTRHKNTHFYGLISQGRNCIQSPLGVLYDNNLLISSYLLYIISRLFIIFNTM